MPHIPNPDPLLTRLEAAEMLRIKPETLEQWAVHRRYDLPMIRVGRRVMYRKSDLDRWLALRTVGSVPANGEA